MYGTVFVCVFAKSFFTVFSNGDLFIQVVFVCACACVHVDLSPYNERHGLDMKLDGEREKRERKSRKGETESFTPEQSHGPLGMEEDKHTLFQRKQYTMGE